MTTATTQSPEELRAQIRRTREDLGETVEALAAKTDVKADAKAGAKAKSNKQTIDERVAMWLKTCLQDWDTATHMSKEQWRTTCERVSKERGKFLNETPETLSLPGKR